MKIFGYIILLEDLKVPKHRLNATSDYFPYIIFETFEDAKRYALPEHRIHKVRININKRNLL